MNEYIKMISEYGSLIVLAGLFIWVFVQDRTKNSKLLEDNNKLLENIAKANENIAKSNENIAKSLDMLKTSQSNIEYKIDRNYEILKERKDN